MVRLRKITVALICLLIPLGHAAAQDVQVSIQARPSTVELNGQFRLTVTVSGALNNLPDPRIQGLDQFRVVGSSQSSQISIVNGRINATKSIAYTILAAQEGTFELGPAVLAVDGETYSSNTVAVTVTRSAGGAPQAQQQQPAGKQRQAQPSQPPPQSSARPGRRPTSGDGGVFVRGRTDKQEVFLGEQLTYTFGFYSRIRMTENPEYTEPKFEGFWKEDIDKEANVSNQTVGGALYRVQELRYALFPTVSGKAKITAARLTYFVRNIWDFFDRGRRVELATNPLEIKIKPLPSAGRPANFAGAVGSYKISASLDKNEVRAGDALTLDVRVEGSGNVRTINEPSLSGLDNFDVYESSSDVSVGFAGTTVRGTKTVKYVIVPRKAGQYDWQGLEFSYFDPSAGQYRTVSTGELSVTVLESGKEETFTYRAGGESVVALGRDINYIKENVRSALRAAPEPLNTKPWFWPLHLLPLAAVGCALLYRRHRGRLMSDRGYARYRVSDRKAAATLKAADRSARNGDLTAAYADLNRAATNYIGDRLNVEAAGMTVDEIDNLLSGRGIDEQVRDNLRSALDHFAFVRFAAGAAGDLETFKEYKAGIGKLLNNLGRKL
ncbi:MAG: protein BatD [Candidatus Glassbacteria bacterium]|nr:protein BatD [Candidatus Glassbacteria bacterium]